MFARSRMIALTVLVTAVGLLISTSQLTGQPPSSAPQTAEPKSATDLRSPQELNAELFRKFQRELLFLAQKLERSERPEDKERAKVIFAALELAKKENVENQFQKMVAGLAKGGTNLQQLDSVSGQDAQLTKVLQEILGILMTDDAATVLKQERERLEKILAEARDILRNQKTIRAMTDVERVEAARIAKDQNQVTDRTKELAKRLGSEPKDTGKGQEGIAKAEPKPEAKSGDDEGAAKPDTQQPKSSSKDSKGGDPMKPGQESGSDKKPAGKDAKSANGDDKASPEDKQSDQAGSPRDSGDKEGASKEGKEGSSKDAAGKEGSNKEGQGKEGKEAAGTPTSKSDGKGQGQGKGQDKLSPDSGGEGKGSNAKEGEQQQAKQQGGAKGGGQPQPGGQPQQGAQQPGQQAQQQQQAQQPGRKQLQDAYPHQKSSEDDLKKDQREQATKQQEKAIEQIAKAIQELEKKIKQLREEEMLKLLANLEARCSRMLAMQIEVYEATKAIDSILLKNNGVKTTAEVQKSQQQADKEIDIIAEAEKTLKLLESEGTAVAFARVLEEVRQDMIAVQRRLNDTYVGKDTQEVEENIITMLKEMLLALKKAQQDQQQQQKQDQQQQQPQKPGDKKLIEQVAELKLIRTLQMNVNSRTKGTAERYKGEQASSPIIQAELRQLADKQANLQDMVNKIASGNNQ